MLFSRHCTFLRTDQVHGHVIPKNPPFPYASYLPAYFLLALLSFRHHHAQNGVFVSCDGDNQDIPGIYTSEGQVVTYSQPHPAESIGAIYTSAKLYPWLARATADSANVTPTSSAMFFRPMLLGVLRVQRWLLRQ
ncbi:hypothetical protein BDQ17DRAFT_480568 [Cyathus striatus]|nr:hypothetical protein BDQ17DRAFT_480568 [Cyathus striatus]